uniref:C-type lectin domain-containing protein n=1 Tax=Mastacembelus armatus TaxID=205130 RepID=A0A3Q3S3H4_9TELE
MKIAYSIHISICCCCVVCLFILAGVNPFLFSGFCVSTSHPNIYYFIGENKTWQDAQTYCVTEHITLAEIQSQENLTAIMSTPANGYQNKAWIGLSKSPQWFYVDGQLGTFLFWDFGQPDNINECVIINAIGLWVAVTNPFFCYGSRNHSGICFKVSARCHM